ncbi:hypothetical protein BDV96DRAFT_280698 [Lophiotrema nucula]|uniref:Uncharacterized protein n=1 Tax=Lophiotrema nucula TaxID=690887 RepID=A0A6A5ZNZ3_9PLEO|nr:hypothetical protein BDV96DRAFT_280698 [Lophiotrema nucula]
MMEALAAAEGWGAEDEDEETQDQSAVGEFEERDHVHDHENRNEDEGDKSYMHDTETFSSKRRPTMPHSGSSFARRRGSASSKASSIHSGRKARPRERRGRAARDEGIRTSGSESGFSGAESEGEDAVDGAENASMRGIGEERARGEGGDHKSDEGGREVFDDIDEASVSGESLTVGVEEEEDVKHDDEGQEVAEEEVAGKRGVDEDHPGTSHQESIIKVEEERQEDKTARPSSPLSDIWLDQALQERDPSAAIRRRIKPRKITEFRQELEDFRSFLREKPVLPPPVVRRNSLGETEVFVDALEHRQELLGDHSKTFVDNIERLKGHYEDLQGKRAQVESDRVIAKRQLPNLVAETKSLENAISNAKDELKEMSASPEVSDDHRGRLRRLEDDIAAMQKTCTSNLKTIEAYKKLLQTTERELDELARIGAGFKALLEECVKKLVQVEKEKQAGEEEIERLKIALSDEIEKKGRAMRDANMTEKSRFEQKYEEKKLELRQLQDDFQAYRRRMAFLYKPQLAQDNERLRRRLNEAEDHIRRVQVERDEAEDNAMKWESEYHISKAEYSQRLENAHIAIDELRVEMHGYAKEYHDSLPVNNPDYWDVRELQSEVYDRSREIAKKQDDIEKYKTEIRRWQITYDDLIAKGVEEMAWESIARDRKPRYKGRKETAERNKQIAALRKKLAEERLEREAIADLIEKAKKRQLGKHYPPRHPHYKKISDTSSWERWKVNDYLEGAPPADRELGIQLKERRVFDLERQMSQQ